MTVISRPTDKVTSPAQPTSQPTSKQQPEQGLGWECLCNQLLLCYLLSICWYWGLLCLVGNAGRWRQSAGMAVGLSHLTRGRSRREGRLPSCVPAWWRPCCRPRHPAAATRPPHRPPPAHHPALACLAPSPPHLTPHYWLCGLGGWEDCRRFTLPTRNCKFTRPQKQVIAGPKLWNATSPSRARLSTLDTNHYFSGISNFVELLLRAFSPTFCYSDVVILTLQRESVLKMIKL